MGGNNEFFENFERNKYLKKLPSMQRVKMQLKISAETSKKNLWCLTLSPPNKLSSAKFLARFNFHSASMLLKVGENVKMLS